ncbi:MAG: dTDP-glucose 4,6-dehydratase [Candidatus Omnitrophota bacterium]|nr:MAG: dTDP-glucose 4,6-dehydratase [Candidatus Omnitrophota bacterium]
MNILVTGGCGFIGSNFIRYMLKKYRNIKIINLDKLTYAGNLNNLKDIEKDKRYKFIKGDICNSKLVDSILKRYTIYDIRYTTIINFAAETHVDRSIKDATDFIKTNVEGVRVLLDVAKRYKIEKFQQISTDEVYGDIKKGFSKEPDKLLPNSPYAASKAAADSLCLSYYHTYNLPIIITRSSNNFGQFQYPEKVMPLFITNVIEGKKLPLYGDGKNIRDWLYVGDNCSGIDFILRKGKPGQVYNIGGGNQIRNTDMAKAILKKFNLKANRIKYVADRPGHDRRYALNSNKIKRLGWKPKYSFDKALTLTVDWYRKNLWWWKPLKRKAKIISW